MRDRSADLMKGFITVVMVVGHLAQFFKNIEFFWFCLDDYYVSFFPKQTFAVFIFSFGYVCNLAYLERDVIPKKHILKGALTSLLAYYVSAFSVTFIAKRDYSLSTVLKILFQFKIASVSECLLCFAWLFVFIAVFGEALKKLLNGPHIYVYLAIIISVLTTFLPTDRLNIPQIGSIIGGSSDFSFYPIVQNSGYFIMGAFLSKNRMTFNKTFFGFCLACYAVAAVAHFGFKIPFTRFPVNAVWLLKSYIFIYLYYLVFKFLGDKKFPFSNTLAVMGQNTLTILLVSNIALFTTWRYRFDLTVKPAPMLYVYFLAAVYVICAIIIKGRAKYKKYKKQQKITTAGR